DRGRAAARAGARPRARADARRRGADGAADVHGDARAAPDRRRARPRRQLLGAGRVKIRVGHLYPDYLNIYADRGNIAVLAERARLRGHELELRAIGMRDPVPVGEVDLFYVGGGQDREQALVAHDLAGKASALKEADDAGAAFLAVCGGYQLLGHFYRDVAGVEHPGIGLLPLRTVAEPRRMIGDVLLECDW